MQSTDNFPSSASSDAQPGKRIYLGNLPYQATPQDVQQYLNDAGFEVERVDMTTDPLSGRNPSYCFAELFSVEEAQRALSALPGASFMGRPLKVNVHTPRRAGASGGFGGSDRPRGGMGFPERGGGGRSAGFGSRDGGGGERPSYGQRQSDFNSAPAEQSTRLYVGGLPQIDNQDSFGDDVMAIFKDYKVETVSKVIAPHESKLGTPGNHYYCFVDLTSVEEAQAAAAALDGVESPWGGNLKINAAKARTSERRMGGDRDRQQAEKPAVVRDFNNWRRG